MTESLNRILSVCIKHQLELSEKKDCLSLRPASRLSQKIALETGFNASLLALVGDVRSHFSSTTSCPLSLTESSTLPLLLSPSHTAKLSSHLATLSPPYSLSSPHAVSRNPCQRVAHLHNLNSSLIRHPGGEGEDLLSPASLWYRALSKNVAALLAMGSLDGVDEAF